MYSRSREKAAPTLAAGATWCDTPAAVAAHSDVVITMVGYPSDVEQVWLGADGVLAGARNALLIDMTTSSPELARRLDSKAAERGCRASDAPVSGGEAGARDAKLSIMVSGPQDAFDAALPVLKLMGTNIVRQGEAGAGQAPKPCSSTTRHDHEHENHR